MKRKIDIADELDIFREVVPVTSLFMPENKGNAELHEMFKNIFVTAELCRYVCTKSRSFLSDTSCSFMHRDVFDRDRNVFVNRLIAHAHSGCPHHTDVSICGDGFFQASCRKCYSQVGMYLDEGHINICEHELELLLEIDLLMSDDKNFIPELKLRRMEALLAKQKCVHKKIENDDPQKSAMLSWGMAFAGFEWIGLNNFENKMNEKEVYHGKE